LNAALNPALNPYRAPWWLPGGHLQSIYPSLRRPPRVSLQRSRWRTPDGDFVDVDFAGDAAAERLLVVFHGLEGGSNSHYARALAGYGNGSGFGSPSIWSPVTVPTTDTKAKCPERPEAIPW